MAHSNKTCCICKKKYSYCPTCSGDINKPTWMAVFCCKNCRDLYNTINDYRYKVLSKKDAFSKLSILDLSCVNELPDNFKAILNEILDKVNGKKEEVIIEQVIEDTIVEELNIEPINVVIEKEEKIVDDKLVESEVINEIKKPKLKKKVKSVE